MTPAARLQMAAELLDQICAGAAAEKVLTRWARASRFAGSKDRAAIRDHVFDALRCKRSFAHLGGSDTGRGLMLGWLREAGLDPDTYFTGARHAPAPLSDAERDNAPPEMPRLVALDCPDWLAPELERSLGAEFGPVLAELRARAPVFVRVNTARITRREAGRVLREGGIESLPHPLADTALELTANARALQNSAPYQDGLVELQDASSQAVVAALPDLDGAEVLDYCAGGGGKALAMAARGAQVSAHDAAPRRMADLPARAARAGAAITLCDDPQGTFDLVLTDVPCSGTGAWRRTPDAKWRLTQNDLDQLLHTQSQILDRAAQHVRPGGWLAYATCSLLQCENADQVAAFQSRHRGFSWHSARNFTPLEGGDGFHLSLLQRENCQ